MSNARRTKIIATVGPAQDPPGAMERLLDVGVDVLRVNLSHASPQDQAARVRRARAHRPDIAVLADLCGPKLRLGDLANEIPIAAGETLVIGAGGVPSGDPTLFARVRVGDPVFIADGTIALEATAIAADRLTCRVRVGGTLRSRKGINIPRDASSIPVLTDKDRRDLAELDVLDADFVAVSYVRHEQDLADVRALTSLPLIAKIEKQQALDRLDAILAASDAIMVARGDLGVEIPIERVPGAQKRLIAAANRAGRPVITATQMLVSMVSSPLPTRAEVTDVANAVLDGTDAVMLSEETAVGHDPVAAVEMMTRILVETEALPRAHGEPTHAHEGNALAVAAARLADDLDADAIIAPTRTGISALRLSTFRPRRPILAYSRVPATTRRLRLAWGVTAIDLAVADGADTLTATLDAARRMLRPGARVVVLDIAPAGARGVASLVNSITL